MWWRTQSISSVLQGNSSQFQNTAEILSSLEGHLIVKEECDQDITEVSGAHHILSLAKTDLKIY